MVQVGAFRSSVRRSGALRSCGTEAVGPKWKAAVDDGCEACIQHAHDLHTLSTVTQESTLERTS